MPHDNRSGSVVILPFIFILATAQPIALTDVQLLGYVSTELSQDSSNPSCFESDDTFDDLVYCPGGAY